MYTFINLTIIYIYKFLQLFCNFHVLPRMRFFDACVLLLLMQIAVLPRRRGYSFFDLGYSRWSRWSSRTCVAPSSAGISNLKTWAIPNKIRVTGSTAIIRRMIKCSPWRSGTPWPCGAGTWSVTPVPFAESRLWVSHILIMFPSASPPHLPANHRVSTVTETLRYIDYNCHADICAMKVNLYLFSKS